MIRRMVISDGLVKGEITLLHRFCGGVRSEPRSIHENDTSFVGRSVTNPGLKAAGRYPVLFAALAARTANTAHSTMTSVAPSTSPVWPPICCLASTLIASATTPAVAAVPSA